MNENKFLGLPYPVSKNPLGLFRSQRGVNQIKSDLLVLLLTNPGERVMLPDFGTPLRRFLFEPADSITTDGVREAIIESIERYEPRVAISDIEVTTQIDDNTLNPEDLKQDLGYILLIKIRFFDPENIQEIFDLDLELPSGTA